MAEFLKRTWAEIDVDAVGHNYRAIRAHVTPDAKIMSIVKADAYGHGVEEIARALAALGSDWFGVSNLEEARELRGFGITAPILILGYTPPDAAAELARDKYAQTIYSLDHAQALARTARQAGCHVDVHVKVDTGMNRLGFPCLGGLHDESELSDLVAACHLPGLNPQGIFTHFAVADEGKAGRDFTGKQFRAFTSTVEALMRRGITFALRHCCNSAGLLAYPEMHLDLVRPGIILYGLPPSRHLDAALPLRPVMQLKSVIAMVKEISPGDTVSYGRTYTAKAPMRVATVPIGYADGYLRCLSSRAFMLVAGQRCKILGRVCMDQLVLDVTDIPGVIPGMKVTAFGRDGEGLITALDVADWAETIDYEIVCSVSKRVPRVCKAQPLPTPPGRSDPREETPPESPDIGYAEEDKED